MALEFHEFWNSAGATQHGPNQFRIIDPVFGGHERVEIEREILVGVIRDNTNSGAGNSKFFADGADNGGFHFDGVGTGFLPQVEFFFGGDSDAAVTAKFR